jgi:hypothetical protein
MKRISIIFSVILLLVAIIYRVEWWVIDELERILKETVVAGVQVKMQLFVWSI